MEEVELKQYILDYSKSIAKGDDDVLEKCRTCVRIS